jgi:hypothetical protein
VSDDRAKSGIEPHGVEKRRLNRRTFVAGVSAAVAGSALLPAHTTLAAVEGMAQPGGQLTLDYTSFAGCLGETFRLSHDGGRFAVKLIDVKQGATEILKPGTHPRAGRVENFSVLFSATGGEQLQQGMYSFYNRRFGRFSLFITPGNSDGQMHLYVAIFHRLAR